jgi:hypothetical protein
LIAATAVALATLMLATGCSQQEQDYQLLECPRLFIDDDPNLLEYAMVGEVIIATSKTVTSARAELTWQVGESPETTQTETPATGVMIYTHGYGEGIDFPNDPVPFPVDGSAPEVDRIKVACHWPHPKDWGDIEDYYGFQHEGSYPIAVAVRFRIDFEGGSFFWTEPVATKYHVLQNLAHEFYPDNLYQSEHCQPDTVVKPPVIEPDDDIEPKPDPAACACEGNRLAVSSPELVAPAASQNGFAIVDGNTELTWQWPTAIPQEERWYVVEVFKPGAGFKGGENPETGDTESGPDRWLHNTLSQEVKVNTLGLEAGQNYSWRVWGFCKNLHDCPAPVSDEWLISVP